METYFTTSFLSNFEKPKRMVRKSGQIQYMCIIQNLSGYSFVLIKKCKNISNTDKKPHEQSDSEAGLHFFRGVKFLQMLLLKQFLEVNF